MVDAGTSDITVFEPVRVGAGTSVSFAVVGADATSTSSIALGNSDCSMLVANTAYPTLGAVEISVPATAGVYTVCYSTDSSVYQPQTIGSVTVVSAEPDSFAGLAPNRIGESVPGVLTLSGPAPSFTSMVALGDATCSALASAALDYDGPTMDVGSGVVPGTHTLCYSVDDGLSWVAQDGVVLDIVTAQPDEVCGGGSRGWCRQQACVNFFFFF